MSEVNNNSQLSLSATLRSILMMLQRRWGVLLLIQFCSLVWALESNIMPYVLRMVINAIEQKDVVLQGGFHPVTVAIVVGAVAWFSILILFHLGDFLSARFVPTLKAEIRMSAYDYVSKQSYGYFNTHMSGSIASQISELARSSWEIVELLMQTFIPAFLGVVIAVVMFAQLSPMFGVIMGVWVIAHMMCCLYFARKCRTLSQMHSLEQMSLVGKIVDSIGNHAIVRLFAGKNQESRYIRNAQASEQARYHMSLNYIAKMKLCLGLLHFFWLGVVMTAADVYAYQQGWIGVGELVYIVNTANNIGMMVWFVAMMMPQLFIEIGVCNQGLSLLHTPLTMKDAPDATELQVKDGTIEFRGVSFQYHSTHPLFANKNILIPARQKVGLVGFSGSGKTTFVNLILRYFDISGGAILIDGQDISKVTQDSLRRSITMIPQEPGLFHRSIIENIRYGNPDATDEDIYWAAQMANCEQFISKMPEGYNTIIGERGSKLSGGQRQRIVMARAFLKNTKILILDEATSALDTATERLIQDAINKIMIDKTTLVVAHRLSTLVRMDRILVFKDGMIVEDGAHNDLIEQNGHYAELWNLQMDGFLIEGELLGDDGEEYGEEYNER